MRLDRDVQVITFYLKATMLSTRTHLTACAYWEGDLWLLLLDEHRR
jgi:hypothetical protein